MFTEDKVTEIFCMADDFCRFFDAMMEKYTLRDPKKRKYHRDGTLSKAEVMVIIILFHNSGYRSAGYRTLVSARDVSLPEGLEAYIVTEDGTEDVKLRKVNNVKANRPYILKGEQGGHTLTIIESADEPTGNLLQISNNETGDGVFVLAKKAQGVGFYKWTGGLLGAGRVYLPASSEAPFLGFEFDEGETTSISEEFLTEPSIKAERRMNGEESATFTWYDLSGRKLQGKPTAKGIYIMNGKKISY